LAIIAVSSEIREALISLVVSGSTPQAIVRRARIILELDRTQSASAAMHACGVSKMTIWDWVRNWRERSHELDGLSGTALSRQLTKVLSRRRPKGLTTKFTPAQVAALLALACEPPVIAGVPVPQWTITSLAEEAVRRGIVPSISRSTLHGFLKSGRPQAS
jgi:transposase